MLDSLLILTILICLVTDLKRRKIYNGILLPAFGAGLSINIFTNSWTGLILSGQGFFLGLGLLILPFALGGIGAGDVKLLATIGAIKGPVFVLYTFLGMGIAGGVVAVAIIIYKNGVINGVKNIGKGFAVLFISKLKVISFGEKIEKITFPYAIAITFGVVVAYLVG